MPNYIKGPDVIENCLVDRCMQRELRWEIDRLRLCLQEISDLQYGGTSLTDQAHKFNAALSYAKFALSKKV